MKLFSAALIAFVAAGIAGAGAAEEESSDLNTLPPVVQRTAKALVGNSKIEEVEPTFENGKHAFEVEFKHDGKAMAIVISREGKLIQTEVRLAVGDAPAKVRAAALKEFPGGKISRLRSVEIQGISHFEVTVQVEGKSHTLNLDKDGKAIN